MIVLEIDMSVLYEGESASLEHFLSFRWGNTPLDDAMQFGHDEVVKLLQVGPNHSSITLANQSTL